MPRPAPALLPALVLLVTPGTASAAWSPDVAAARAYAESRPGTTSFAVQVGAGTFGHRTARTAPAASLMKTLFLIAHLRRGDVRGRPLRRDERAALAAMVRRSANPPASRLSVQLGPDRLRRLARAAGLRDLRLASPIWGASRTSARDQARLFARLPRLLPERHAAFARRLLRTVVPSQRWGIGRVRLPPGWTAYFKGGWGSGTGAVDHQAVRLEHRDGRRVALAVLTTGNGTHAAGKATLRGVFARLLRNLPD